MRIGWHIAFWLGAAAILLLLLWLCWPILPPFIIALALGYLLDPVASWLQRLGLGRLMAALMILAAFMIVLVLLFILVFPILGHQLSSFIQQLPETLNKLQSLLEQAGNWAGQQYVGPVMKRLGLAGGSAPDIRSNVESLVGDAARTAGAFLNSLVMRGAAVISVVSLLIITPVVAFYVLLDWHKMMAAVDSLIPLRHRETAHQLLHEIDVALAGFLRGQSLVCLFLGLWYGLGLSLVGLNFGLLIGLSAGLLSFIPYVGSLAALVISAIVAIVQDWPHWQLFAMAMGVVLAGQFLESNILSPKLVGDKVGVHPVWLIFALFAFGSLLGFLGLMIAVPFAAAVGVLLRFAVRRYRTSEFYLGMPAWLAGPPPPPGIAAKKQIESRS
ncbi:AI-2E family transporter [Methylovirgula sp. HY1]|uniref:AI-2E family transporter n=1 Tax=Methylovirgula sp. HY1 TaxID=2822761 RepID=UPI001C5BB714|nr:AI-2E family transporter [Methylovirgula sp. HY1]QXX73793.1 AI-2 transport protein TqsA [Methylovirgula sp. HY1]